MDPALLRVGSSPSWLLVAAGSGAADGGPSPGRAASAGTASRLPAALVRYVALPGGSRRDDRRCRARQRRAGHALRVGAGRRRGPAGRVRRDARTASRRTAAARARLGTPAPAATPTTFVVLTPHARSRQQRSELPGLWSFDAISPDGSTIYAIAVRTTPVRHELPRARDRRRHRPRPSGAIVDKRDPEVMRGSPVTRAEASRHGLTRSTPGPTAPRSSTRSTRATGRPPASTCRGRRTRGNGIWNVRLVASTGGSLRLRQPGVGTLASVDLGTPRRPVVTDCPSEAEPRRAAARSRSRSPRRPRRCRGSR